MIINFYNDVKLEFDAVLLIIIIAANLYIVVLHLTDENRLDSYDWYS